MNLINLTPHEVVVFSQDGITVLGKIAPSGVVARVAATRKELGVIPISSDAAAVLRGDIGAAIPVYGVEYGAIENLPPSERGVIYITSALVRQAVPNRRDVVSPGELVRDAKGQPVGCKGFDGN